MNRFALLPLCATLGILSLQISAQDFDQTYPGAGSVYGAYLEKSGAGYSSWSSLHTNANPAEWTNVIVDSTGNLEDVSVVSMPNPLGDLIFRTPGGRYYSAKTINQNNLLVRDLDVFGNVGWSNTILFSNADAVTPLRFAINPAKEIFVSGFLHPTGTPAGTYHVFLLKLNSNGQALWQTSAPGFTQPYYSPTQFLAPAQDGSCYVWIGGTGSDSGFFHFSSGGTPDGSQKVTCCLSEIAAPAAFPDGNILIAYSQKPPSSPVGYTGVLEKRNPDGTVVWGKTVNQILQIAPGQNAWSEQIYAINTTPDGRILVAGVEIPFIFGSTQFFAIELDGDGNLIKKETGAYFAQPRFIRAFEDGSVLVTGLKNNEFWIRRYSTTAYTGTIDLELSAEATNPNPALYIYTSAKFTLQNKGTAPAQNIEVKINKPANGLIYKGLDEYAASQGSFSPYGDEVWRIDELAEGASAVLNLNFFNLDTTQKIVYAQVNKATGLGDDSEPGNGIYNICCTPAEDDEAEISFNGVLAGSADLSVQLLWNGPPRNNGPTNFSLQVSNAGPSTATGVVVKVEGVAIGHQFTVLAASQGVYSVGNREWMVGNLPAGTTATLNYDEFMVDFDGYGPAWAFVQVQVSNQNDPNSTPGNKATGAKIPTENDESAILVYPLGNAVFHDLDLSMSANRSTALPGDEVDILLKVNNSAAFAVSGVTAKVVLPSGFQLLSALPSAGNYDASTGIWDIGYVERPGFPGAEKSLVLRVKITEIGVPKTIYAQIMTSNGFNDPDSQVGNGVCCTPVEDDEAAVTLDPSSFVGCNNNLLNNSGFENDFINWTNIGGAEIITDTHTGSKATKLCNASAGGLIQNRSAQAGKNYTLLAWGKRDNSPNTGANMVFWIKFLSNTWQPITIQSVQVNANSYTAYTLDAIAPVGTAWLEVGIYKHNGTGCLFADDLCLTETGTGGGLPDLAFDLVKPKFTPEVIVNNEPFRATLPFENMGTALSGNFQVGFYVSQKNVLDNTAVLLSTAQHFPIQAGISLNTFFETSIPASFPTGNAYFIAKLDHLDQNTESDEGNNLYVVPVHIQGYGEPNVSIDYSGDEGNIAAGGSFTLDDYQVFCNGVRAMPAHVQRVYLSTDNALDASDLLLHSYNAGLVPVCGNSGFACSFFSLGDIQIPVNTLPGVYYVLVKLDADNAVAEVSETDNVGFASITVTSAPFTYCFAWSDFPWEDWISG